MTYSGRCLTGQELDEYKAELIAEDGWSESLVEDLVVSRDSDDEIRRAFPEILPSDKRESASWRLFCV
jgi:zona occludens toxin (predicted ATPase)